METSLALTYDDLRKAVAYYLGYGRMIADWTDEAAEHIAECVKSGLRSFYFPPPIKGVVHRWSFLQPSLENFVTASGTWEYLLPDDFGGLVNHLCCEDSNGTRFDIRVTGVGEIDKRRMGANTITTRPSLAAVRPKKHKEGLKIQRSELVLWPTPDAAYTLRGSYYVLPQALSEHREHPYGGTQHAETLKAACLAAAERDFDDMASTQAGAFMTSLQASIVADLKLKPANLGYNADRSDAMSHEPRGRFHGCLPVTWSGVEYPGT